MKLPKWIEELEELAQSSKENQFQTTYIEHHSTSRRVPPLVLQASKEIELKA